MNKARTSADWKPPKEIKQDSTEKKNKKMARKTTAN